MQWCSSSICCEDGSLIGHGVSQLALIAQCGVHLAERWRSLTCLCPCWSRSTQLHKPGKGMTIWLETLNVFCALITVCRAAAGRAPRLLFCLLAHHCAMLAFIQFLSVMSATSCRFGFPFCRFAPSLDPSSSSSRALPTTTPPSDHLLESLRFGRLPVTLAADPGVFPC